MSTSKARNLLIIGVIVVIVALILTYPRFFATTEIELYFSDAQDQLLVVETRDVRRNNLYQNTIEELIKGPQSEEVGVTIPPETEVIDLEIKDQLAIADFNQELVEEHWGGTTGEILTVYSIVTTLAQFDEIEQVQILVEGEKMKTLSGHLNLEQPLEVDPQLIK
ncbi:GerMN domain-containing protein [Natroniella sulfidigena]|uniref:GerMN domain-containing protein n=1 Tax=Natroniella sulfidigena TaxID=723921 RepID=UPI00200AA662|nr:GerMN domain-containing protein [Natroniella sulfidigena]MCK8817127.1 GerMN domain-containing protein [Natroniella sulfidigena]